MKKTITKEIVIILLLVLAILLVLGIFLYDYMPMNKVVPKIEQYETPQNVKQIQEEEDKNSGKENQETSIVYEITSDDLSIYEKTKDYQKGKVNPFADISNSIDNTVTTNSNGVNENNQGTTTTNKKGSEGSYLPKSGIK